MALVAYSPVAKGRIKNDRTLARIGGATARPRRRFACAGWCSRMFAAIPRTSRIERLSENIDIFDFSLDRRRDGRNCGPGQREEAGFTDFGFAPKWD